MTIQRRYQAVSERRIRASLFRILAANELCSIATVARGSRAHINTAFFAYSTNLEVYFLSDPESLHCRNLLGNPSMAMTIFRSSQGWDEPGQGVQLFGTGRRAVGRQDDLARKVYGTRLPAFKKWLKSRTPRGRRQALRLRSYAFFRFLPGRVKILDESEFGGALFVVAKIKRALAPERSRRAGLRWQKRDPCAGKKPTPEGVSPREYRNTQRLWRQGIRPPRPWSGFGRTSSITASLEQLQPTPIICGLSRTRDRSGDVNVLQTRKFKGTEDYPSSAVRPRKRSRLHGETQEAAEAVRDRDPP